MSHYIIQINTFEIKEGKLEEFKKRIKSSQAFAKSNDPLLMAEMYIDEESMEARAFLIHQNSESILAHWKISAKHMTEVMEFCYPKRVEILGKPGSTVMEQLWRYREAGVVVTMLPHFAGFSHF